MNCPDHRQVALLYDGAGQAYCPQCEGDNAAIFRKALDESRKRSGLKALVRAAEKVAALEHQPSIVEHLIGQFEDALAIWHADDSDLDAYREVDEAREALLEYYAVACPNSKQAAGKASTQEGK